jgi:hypothetical protein
MNVRFSQLPGIALEVRPEHGRYMGESPVCRRYSLDVEINRLINVDN